MRQLPLLQSLCVLILQCPLTIKAWYIEEYVGNESVVEDDALQSSSLLKFHAAPKFQVKKKAGFLNTYRLPHVWAKYVIRVFHEKIMYKHMDVTGQWGELWFLYSKPILPVFPCLKSTLIQYVKPLSFSSNRARIQFEVIRQWKCFTIEGSLKPIPHLFCTCCLSFVVHSLCLF